MSCLLSPTLLGADIYALSRIEPELPSPADFLIPEDRAEVILELAAIEGPLPEVTSLFRAGRLAAGIDTEAGGFAVIDFGDFGDAFGASVFAFVVRFGFVVDSDEEGDCDAFFFEGAAFDAGFAAAFDFFFLVLSSSSSDSKKSSDSSECSESISVSTSDSESSFAEKDSDSSLMK